MRSISLGFAPIPITVILARGSAFAASLTNADGWPAGAAIELHVEMRDIEPATTVVWSAAVAGTDATWSVPAADVDPVLAAGATKARVYYQDTDLPEPLLWMAGPVVAQ